VVEGLTTALDIKKLPVNDLGGQGAQMVLTLKMTYVPTSQTSYRLTITVPVKEITADQMYNKISSAFP
jgi:hypothetical protein